MMTMYDDDDDDDGDCDGDGVVAILAIHKKKALSFNGFTRWRVAMYLLVRQTHVDLT